MLFNLQTSRDERVFCAFSNPCCFYLEFYVRNKADENNVVKQPGIEGCRYYVSEVDTGFILFRTI